MAYNKKRLIDVVFCEDIEVTEGQSPAISKTLSPPYLLNILNYLIALFFKEQNSF